MGGSVARYGNEEAVHKLRLVEMLKKQVGVKSFPCFLFVIKAVTFDGKIRQKQVQPLHKLRCRWVLSSLPPHPRMCDPVPTLTCRVMWSQWWVMV